MSKGFQIVLASDGEAALTATFAQAFDLIILDVMMPGINGIEACREIRRQQKYSCAVFVGSGRGRRSARRICSRSR